MSSDRSTRIPPRPRGHWPAGWLVVFALILLGYLALRFMTGCEALIPALTAAGPLAASGLDAYSKAIEAARSNGATADQLAQILAGITEVLRLEREHASRCAIAEKPPEDPAALAKALNEKAILREQLALEEAKVATLLEAIVHRDVKPANMPDGGAP
jgi:hypothetical protein